MAGGEPTTAPLPLGEACMARARVRQAAATCPGFPQCQHTFVPTGTWVREAAEAPPLPKFWRAPPDPRLVGRRRCSAEPDDGSERSAISLVAGLCSSPLCTTEDASSRAEIEAGFPVPHLGGVKLSGAIMASFSLWPMHSDRAPQGL